MASAYGGGTEKTSRFKVLLSKEEEIENRVREGFSILVQGIELIHYETLNMLIGGKKNKKIFWMVCKSVKLKFLRACIFPQG